LTSVLVRQQNPQTRAAYSQIRRPSKTRNQLYGYRPGRSATDAIKEVHRLICRGYTNVVDADLSKYLDAVSYCPQGY
jgi:retron-type reverse transcriptase